jgi:hypothetical protein
VLFHRLQHGARREAEHAGIPEEPATGHIVFRQLQIRLLDEAKDIAVLRLDVAVACFRTLRNDAERHDPSGGGKLLSLGDGFGECLLVADEMIRGKDQEHGVRPVAFSRMDRGKRHRSRRIPAKRLQQECIGKIRRRCLCIGIGREEKKLAVGDGDHRFHAVKLRGPRIGAPDKGTSVGKFDEGLRVHLA